MTPEERRERARQSRARYETTRSARRAADGSASTRARASKRRRRKKNNTGIQLLIAFVIAALVIVGAFFLAKKLMNKGGSAESTPAETVSTEETTTEEPTTEAAAAKAEALLQAAGLLAAQYDYDGALELAKSDPELMEREDVKSFIASTEETKSTLVRFDPHDVTHIFFHILPVDAEYAFTKSSNPGGYNSLMTSIPEFKAILASMYERGYVLISLHDMGHMEKQDDGTEKMVEGDIMLPPGKKAFVMSEDDVCYYEYMKGDGFADKMIIGEDGRPTLHYTDKEGNESTGDYDLVPILDKFIDEHPDFSYHGHKACLVFTGYNGVLGYRTDETYLPENYKEHKVEGGHDVEAERKEAVKVLRALYEDGYDLGSHSWGHRDMGAMSVAALKEDSDKWDRNVNSLIKEATGKDADILIYPKGADIGDWRGYEADNQAKAGCREKFNYLYDLGFRYFCNVDSAKTWVQVGSHSLRTGRRALDGYNFWYEMTENKGRFTDLWDDTSKIFDPVRPTPVPSY